MRRTPPPKREKRRVPMARDHEPEETEPHRDRGVTCPACGWVWSERCSVCEACGQKLEET